MRIFALLLTGWLLTGLPSTFAQAVTEVYPPDGVYATFSSFRNGKPDLMKRQLMRADQAVDFTIRQWVNTEKLLYTGDNGEQKSYDPKNFWAFAEKGVLYLYLGNKFHKVHTLGAISYFLESYPMIKGNHTPVVTEARSTSAYRLMDMETGDIYDYTVENLLDLIERDEPLHTEYKSIVSLKEKKKKMFVYLERFNKSHPLVAETAK